MVSGGAYASNCLVLLIVGVVFCLRSSVIVGCAFCHLFCFCVLGRCLRRGTYVGWGLSRQGAYVEWEVITSRGIGSSGNTKRQQASIPGNTRQHQTSILCLSKKVCMVLRVGWRESTDRTHGQPVKLRGKAQYEK